MSETETRIKEIIIERYGSVKKFCETIDMPWTTLDSILKRGIANSNISNVLKIAKELNVNTELLASGIIKPNSGEELIDYYNDMIPKIIDLIQKKGYRVIQTDDYYDNSLIIKDTSGTIIKTIPESDLLGNYESLVLSNSVNFIQNLLELNDEPKAIAAHKEGENFTPEELEKIEEYKKLLLAARPKE